MFKTISRFRHLGRAAVSLLLVVCIGIIGLMHLEGYELLDALYMTVITISTVGFGEVRALSDQGHLFVVILIICGLSVMTYTLGSIAKFAIEGHFGQILGRRRMQHEISGLKDHYVVCGHGRMGQILCQELREEKVPFVVIEGDDEEALALRELGYLVVKGDATQDEILESAGVARARGLVAVVSSDVDNLYITLSARERTREVNPNLYILARASEPHAITKLKRVGANRVISPYQIGGMRIVQALLRPNAFDFVEVVTQSSGLDLMIEELQVGRYSDLVAISLKDSGIRQRYDMIIIGVKKPSGEMIFNPGPEHVIEAGDVMIVLGGKEQTAGLRGVLG